jgi:superfamily II DNA/RNA helicase
MMRNMAPPAERVSFLYSATLSFRVLELAYEYMNEAIALRSMKGRSQQSGSNRFCIT